jgi:hypothetical protein
MQYVSTEYLIISHFTTYCNIQGMKNYIVPKPAEVSNELPQPQPGQSQGQVGSQSQPVTSAPATVPPAIDVSPPANVDDVDCQQQQYYVHEDCSKVTLKTGLSKIDLKVSSLAAIFFICYPRTLFDETLSLSSRQICLQFETLNVLITKVSDFYSFLLLGLF